MLKIPIVTISTPKDTIKIFPNFRETFLSILDYQRPNNATPIPISISIDPKLIEIFL